MSGEGQNGNRPNAAIDARLRLLLAETPRGVCLTQEEIAQFCGCSRALIYLIEKSALRKLRDPRRSRLLKVWL